MTYEEALKRIKLRYENTKDYSDPHWEGSERREHRKWVEEMECAIEALEKQIPKKPKKETVQVNGYDHGCDDYCYTEESCPSCNLSVLRTSHCDHCGQRLDWGEEN